MLIVIIIVISVAIIIMIATFTVFMAIVIVMAPTTTTLMMIIVVVKPSMPFVLLMSFMSFMLFVAGTRCYKCQREKDCDCQCYNAILIHDDLLLCQGCYTPCFLCYNLRILFEG